jgi:hypothetical protein
MDDLHWQGDGITKLRIGVVTSSDVKYIATDVIMKRFSLFFPISEGIVLFCSKKIAMKQKHETIAGQRQQENPGFA